MFLQFFHDQIVTTAEQETLFRNHPRALIGRLNGAVIWATLVADGPLLVPTVDLVQSPLLADCRSVIDTLVAAELLQFVGSTTDVDALQAQKQTHFLDTGFHQVWNTPESTARLNGYSTALRSRTHNTTADLVGRWGLDLADLDGAVATREGTRQFQEARLLLPSFPSVGKYEKALEKIPARLDGRAFLWNVFEASGLFDLGPAGPAARHFERGMAYNWILSHLEEYDTDVIGTIPGLNPIDFGLATTHPWRVVDLVRYDHAFRLVGLDGAIPALTVEDAIELRGDLRFFALMRDVIRPLATRGRLGQPPIDMPIAFQVRDIARNLGDAIGGVALLRQTLDRYGDLHDVSSLLGNPAVSEAVASVCVRLGSCRDYHGTLRVRFNALLEQIVEFVRTRMNMDRSRAGSRRKYLFESDPKEASLQQDLDDFLSGNLHGPTCEFEMRSVGGGRTDLTIHYGGYRVSIEIKREFVDASPDGIKKFLNQTVAYASTDIALGFLVVLDLTSQREPPRDLRDNIWVEDVPGERDENSRFIVVARIPGNRSRPSDL